METAVKKSALVETQGRIFLALQPFQTSDFMLEMPIFAGIIPIHKEIFALFRQKAPDFIASLLKISGNSYEKNPSL